jgi:hypothetical protein
VQVPDGSWKQYQFLHDKGMTMSVEDALRTPGALVFGFSSDPLASSDRPARAYVAISLGNGKVLDVSERSGEVREMDPGGFYTYAAAIPQMMEDLDSDGDGMPDVDERVLGNNPFDGSDGPAAGSTPGGDTTGDTPTPSDSSDDGSGSGSGSATDPTTDPGTAHTPDPVLDGPVLDGPVLDGPVTHPYQVDPSLPVPDASAPDGTAPDATVPDPAGDTTVPDAAPVDPPVTDPTLPDPAAPDPMASDPMADTGFSSDPVVTDDTDALTEA